MLAQVSAWSWILVILALAAGAGGTYLFLMLRERSARTAATNKATGAESTTQVAGMHSYTIVLPAGEYTLRAGCSVPAEATVVAQQQAVADTMCFVP